MRIQGHLKAAPLLGLLYFIGEIGGVIVAIIASLAIDLDHLHLMVKEKAFTIKKVIELSQDIYGKNSIKRYFEDVTYIFHSIEINILLVILSNWYNPIIYIVIGFSFHIVCDIIHHYRKKIQKS